MDIKSSPIRPTNAPQKATQSDSKGSENYFRDDRYGTFEKERSQYRQKPVFRENYSRRKIFLRTVFGMIFLGILLASIFFLLKIRSVSTKVSIQGESQPFVKEIGSTIASFVSPERRKLRGEENERINILLMGAAGKGKPGQNLTDTIMLMSIDTKNEKISLLSFPRDLYVKIPETNLFTKINSLYQYGLNNNQNIEPLKKTIEEISGVPVNYFLVVDFDGFKKVIDDIGGIHIMVERDIFDARYPGPNYSYETFQLDKGFHLLDGATALKYVRERHDDPEGDFGRAKRQQQVIQAVKNKVFSLQTFLNVFTLNNILNTLGENIKTDIPMDEVESFISLSKEVDTQNINNVVIDAWKKDSLLKVSHVFVGGVRAFILVPRVGNWSEIHDIASNIFHLDEIKKRQAEIAKEEAKILILNRSSDRQLAYKIKDLLREKFNLKDISLGWPNKKNVQEKSLIYSLSKDEKLFTLDELMKKLPAHLAPKNNAIIEEAGEADIVVEIGNDLVKTYSFEEDDIETWKKAEDSQEYFQPIINN